MIATRSASNAVKHGLTSRSFVPDHARAFVEEIRQDLTALHNPQTREETNLVAELAVARWQNYEHDRRFYEREAYEKSIADGLFMDQATDKCRQNLAGLPTSPMLNQFRLAQSYLGVLHLQSFFQTAVATLSENLPISFQQITNCVNAMGDDWRLETLSSQAGHLMRLHLALVENPEEEIAQWVAESQPASEVRASQLAHYHHAHAPDAATARADLLARLGRELAKLTEQVEPLRQQFEEQRSLFQGAYAGFGLQDPKATRAAMLAMRYRTAAYNRLARLEKELETLQKDRADRSPHSVYAHRLPAQARPPAMKEQVATYKELTPIKPAPAPALRNESQPTPATPRPHALAGPKQARQPISNRKKQLARLAKQAK